MPDLVRRVKEQRYRTAALTNTGKEWLEFKREKFGLNELFDLIVCSFEEQIGKPNPRIYQIFLERAEVEGSECLYIDNVGRNLPPAQKLGMQTIEFGVYVNRSEATQNRILDPQASQLKLEEQFREKGILK